MCVYFGILLFCLCSASLVFSFSSKFICSTSLNLILVFFIFTFSLFSLYFLENKVKFLKKHGEKKEFGKQKFLFSFSFLFYPKHSKFILNILFIFLSPFLFFFQILGTCLFFYFYFYITHLFFHLVYFLIV